MIEAFESLPLQGSTLVVAAIALALVVPVAHQARGWIAWVAAIIVPLTVAYALYWAPVWMDHSSDIAQYPIWEPVVVGLWGAAGIIASATYVGLLHRRRRTKIGHV